MSARPLTTIPSPTYEAQRKQVMIAEQQCSQMQGIDGDPRYYLAWHVLVLRAELDATRAQLAETLAAAINAEKILAMLDATDSPILCGATLSDLRAALAAARGERAR